MSCSETLEIQDFRKLDVVRKTSRKSHDALFRKTLSLSESESLESSTLCTFLVHIAKSAWKEFVQWTHNSQFCQGNLKALEYTR